jgi:tetratricopeptide (TPR) repeat protein/mono/diheme cytochrome c family protein
VSVRGLARAAMLLAGLLVADVAAAQQGPVTFTRDVAPVLFKSCAPCHRPDGPGPFSFLTYDEARRHGTQIATVTKSRYMPPWKPDPGAGEFVGERRLTGAEIALIERWVRTGMPEGDAKDLPAPPRWSPGWQLGEPDLIVSLPEYTLRPDGLDVFRMFVVPVPVQAVRYVRGLEFRASSRAVHHANIRIDYSSASRRLDEADPEPGYNGLILNSAEYPDGHFLGWTPGQASPLAPKGLAWQLSPGGDFVVQLHLRPTGAAERIQPSIGLYFSDDPPTRLPAMLRLGRQNIDIPAGEAGYQSVDSFTLPVDVQVQAFQPHAHYRATQVRARAELTDETTRNLIQISRWDFGWQDVYRVSDPYWLPAGTKIVTEFRFDNSARNIRNPESPPRRALWGFKSSDEMADVWIQVLTRTDADRERLVSTFRAKATAEDTVGYELQLRQDSANHALHDDVAILYRELGRPADALRHFLATAAILPGSARAHYNVGTALEAMGQPAAAAYERAISLDSRYAAPRVNLANIQLGQGHVNEAVAQYREAISLDKDNAEARNNLSHVLVLQGALVEAVDLLNQALTLRPSYAEAHFNLAEALTRQGRLDLATRHYREALDLKPDWPPALIGLSWILSSGLDSAMRQPVEAVRLATLAINVTRSTDPAALDALAAAQASAGQFEKAIATATTAADRARRAGALDLAGDIEQRIALYRQRRGYIMGAR